MSAQHPATVLLVEFAGHARTQLDAALAEVGFGVAHAPDWEEALDVLERTDVDVVLTDLREAEGVGRHIRRLSERRPDLPLIVISGSATVELAVQAMRAGAHDFLVHPLDTRLIQVAVGRALEHARLRREVRRLRTRVREVEPFGELLGESAPMRALYRVIERVAAAPSSVLIVGETGTGKELVARALHQRSSRCKGPFVAINCAAVPEALLESELFGHTRGAFTDARTARAGLFVQAHEGTLFLDEIGDMAVGLQAKLLRVLQDRTVRPIGGAREESIDVRVVAATHEDLDRLVEERRFRADLAFRLDVVRLTLPPLRARAGDVLLLAHRFIEHYATCLDLPLRELTTEAAQQLLDYDWPGNVRELQNCMERGLLLAEGPSITVEDLPLKVRGAAPSAAVIAVADDPGAVSTLAEVERRYVLQVLHTVGGSRSRAAELLGIDRKTLYRKLQRWGVTE